MISGGCFCGTIRYEVVGTLNDARSCHCSQCRKIFSGAGSAYAEVSKDADFRWVSGREALKIYASAGDWGVCFCSKCGSTLAGVYKNDVHGLTLGSVDGDPGVQIMKHIFVGSKAPWDHIGGSAPQYDKHADV